MRLKPYLAAVRMSIRASRYFGAAELIGSYAIRALRTLFLLLLWRSLFLSGGQAQGMTLPQLLAYTLCSNALYPLLDIRTPAGSWLHEGSIVGNYLRPLPVFWQLAAHTLGASVVPVCVFAPFCAALGLAFGIPLAPATAWFYPSLMLCVSQGFAVDFLYACLIIRMRNLSYQVHMLREAIFTVFTGGLIPFAAMPWGIGGILEKSPLGTLAGAPLALYAGLSAPMDILPAQLVWNALLWPLSLWLFHLAQERMVSYGG